MRSNQLAHGGDITQGRIKGLMPSTFVIKDIFTNDSPVSLMEDGLPEDPVGMAEAVENEPGARQSLFTCPTRMAREQKV